MLLDADILGKVWTMRRMVSRLTAPPPQGRGDDVSDAMESLIGAIKRTRTNAEFLASLHEMQS
jgi:transcription termination factor Rho